MKRTLLTLAILLAPYAFADNHEAVVAEIEAAVQGFNGAYASGDYETYFAHYTQDAAIFFYGERQTVADYYESWKATVESGFEYEKYDITDMRVQVLGDGDTAVATYFVALGSRTADGQTAEANAFESDVWQKIDGEWKIVTLHYTEF